MINACAKIPTNEPVNKADSATAPNPKLRPAAPPQSPSKPANDSKNARGAGSARRSPIHEALIPAHLQLASGAHPEIDRPAYIAYRDELISEAKSHDVLEETLLEQIALAHLASSRLLANAGVASTAEGQGIFASAAAKLMAEVRRSIVAIKQLHSPPAPPNITVAARQEVHVTGNNGAEAAEKSAARSEVGSINATGTNRMREIFSEDLGGAPEQTVIGAAD